MGIEKIAREGFNKNGEITDKVHQTLSRINKDIYSFFIHPGVIIKKYAQSYQRMFRQYCRNQKY